MIGLKVDWCEVFEVVDDGLYDGLDWCDDDVYLVGDGVVFVWVCELVEYGELLFDGVGVWVELFVWQCLLGWEFDDGFGG